MMVLFTLAPDHAAMRHFAHHVLELDRSVVDAEVVQQPLFTSARCVR